MGSRKTSRSLSIPSYLQWSLAIDHKILQTFSRHTDANSTDFLASNFHFDLPGMIDEHPIIAVCDVERNTFVCLFTRRPSVLVPNADRLSYIRGQNLTGNDRGITLTILHKGPELLS